MLALSSMLGGCGTDASVSTVDTGRSPGSPVPSPPGGKPAEATDGRTFTHPDWARAVTTPGDLLTTVTVGDLAVDVYQVDVVPADRDGPLLGTGTNEPIITEGDDLVVLNYVVRNVGTEPVHMSYARVTFTAAYDDWDGLGGMSGISSSELYDQLNVNESASAIGLSDVDSFTVEPGEWFAQAENYPYQPEATIDLTIHYTPAGDTGDNAVSGRVVGQATAAIR